MILVAAHAVDVVIMHHAHKRQPAVHQGLNHPEIGHFVNIDRVRLKGCKGRVSLGGTVTRQCKAFVEHAAPAVFVLAGSRPVQDSGMMTPPAQFLGGDEGVCFGTRKGAIPFVDVKNFHEVTVVVRR